MRQKKVVSAEEWAFFLKPALAQEGLPPNPSGEGGWLELKVWGSVIKGEEEVPGLAGLRAALETDAAPWRAYAESDAPQNAPLPAGWEGKVTPFQRLLLLKIFRPEKVVFATNEFVASEMGDFFKEAPPFDLLSTFKVRLRIRVRVRVRVRVRPPSRAGRS